jgi:hypothetical protein
MMEVVDFQPERTVTTPADDQRDLRYREFVRLLAENERRLTA